MVACDDMNSIIQDDLDRGEAIYPGRPGYIRPADDVFPGIGKAWVFWGLGPDRRVTETVISYTFNGQTTEKRKSAPVAGENGYYDGYLGDSMLIDNLEEGYYSFSMYTVDKDGKRSIATVLYPQIVQIYGDAYTNSLSSRGIEQMEMLAGGDLKITWSQNTTNMLRSIVVYDDHSETPSGKSKTDTVLNDVKESILSGFKRFKTFSVRSDFRVGIDSASKTELYAPPVVEKALLSTAPNNFVELTDDGANRVTQLTFPLGVGTWTLQDLYYFPNLRTLDLTPETQSLPELRYYREYIDQNKETYLYDTTRYESTVGNIPWLGFVSGYMSPGDTAILADLLKSGQLTKIKYTRNSYPGLDPVLEQYDSKIEWSPAGTLSDGIMIPPELLLNYRVEDRSRGNVTVTHSEDASIISEGSIPKDLDGVPFSNVYRATLSSYGGPEVATQQIANTIAFSLPEGVRFNSKEYRYLKCEVYIQPSNSNYDWMKTSTYSKFEGCKTIKFTRKAKLDNFPETSPYPNRVNGDNVNAYTYSQTFTDDELGTWKTLSVDMGGDPTAYEIPFAFHSRVLVLTLGVDGPWTPAGMTYYLANLRWSKEQ
jgi:hypothetical protein